MDITCTSCGTVVGADEVLAQPGPGMPAEYLERMAAVRAAR
jgi:hypothetical protein